MSKPEWKDAPRWANWLAQDESGIWHWFEFEPEPSYSGMVWDSRPGAIALAYRTVQGWDKTLEARPK
jgi:hypothetical protein